MYLRDIGNNNTTVLAARFARALLCYLRSLPLALDKLSNGGVRRAALALDELPGQPSNRALLDASAPVR